MAKKVTIQIKDVTTQKKRVGIIINNVDPAQPISACTDSAALNYNPEAVVDDGSCLFRVRGCTDWRALNYNPTANLDDGTCIYNPKSTLQNQVIEVLIKSGAKSACQAFLGNPNDCLETKLLSLYNLSILFNERRLMTDNLPDCVSEEIRDKLIELTKETMIDISPDCKSFQGVKSYRPIPRTKDLEYIINNDEEYIQIIVTEKSTPTSFIPITSEDTDILRNRPDTPDTFNIEDPTI